MYETLGVHREFQKSAEAVITGNLHDTKLGMYSDWHLMTTAIGNLLVERSSSY